MVDIIRGGQSLVSDDGNLILVEATDGSGVGSGQAPPTQSSQADLGGRRRRAFLSPMDNLLVLPEDVDEVVFSWSATEEVSLSLMTCTWPHPHWGTPCIKATPLCMYS